MADHKTGMFGTAPPLESAAGLEVTELKAEEIQVRPKRRANCSSFFLKVPSMLTTADFCRNVYLPQWPGCFHSCSKDIGIVAGFGKGPKPGKSTLQAANGMRSFHSRQCSSTRWWMHAPTSEVGLCARFGIELMLPGIRHLVMLLLSVRRTLCLQWVCYQTSQAWLWSLFSFLSSFSLG
jgi:hypothetical protein